jgi:ankyrin repeat protein
MWAVIRGKADVIHYLLDKGANANLSDSMGFTTLDWAKAMERNEIEKTLTDTIQ